MIEHLGLHLLEHPLSPYVQKVKLALHFKGLPFTSAYPMTDAEIAEDFALSPRGEVPLLKHRDLALYDSRVICTYIDETWPEPALMPKSPYARAQIRWIEDAMDTHFEANTWGLAEVTIFRRTTGELADRLTRHAQQQILNWFQWLDQRLSDGGWFNGPSYGWGDMCVVPFVNGAARFDLHPKAGTPLAAWLRRVNEIDAVQLAQSAAAEAELDPLTMQAALTSGFKREYRDHRLEWMIRAGGIDVVAQGLSNNNIRFNGSFS